MLIKKFTIQLLVLFLLTGINVSAQFATLPFESKDNGHLLLKVQVNDSEEDLNFLFDTGAAHGVISKSIAKKMGLQVVSQQQVNGAGGLKTYDILSELELNLSDDVFIACDYIFSVDMARFHQLSDIRYDGIIGFNLLWEFVTQIDYEKKELILFEKIDDADTKDYKVIPFEFHNTTRIPQFDVSFTMNNGEKFKGRIFLDTGAGYTLLINSPFVKKNNLTKKADKSIISKSENLGTTSTSQEIAIKSVQVGDFVFNDLPISLTNDTTGVSSYKGYLGILGAQIIKRFHVILDYHSKKLYLKPNRFFDNTFEFPLSGIRLKKRNDEIFVGVISDQSPAYQKGLREGDIILSINGTNYNTLSEYQKLLKKEGSSVVVKVKTTSGETKTYTFELKRLI